MDSTQHLHAVIDRLRETQIQMDWRVLQMEQNQLKAIQQLDILIKQQDGLIQLIQSLKPKSSASGIMSNILEIASAHAMRWLAGSAIILYLLRGGDPKSIIDSLLKLL